MELFKLKDKLLIDKCFYYYLVLIKKHNLNKDSLEHRFKWLEVKDLENLYAYTPSIEIQQSVINLIQPLEILKERINQLIDNIKKY